MRYEYHHMGIPTTEKRDGERYVPKFKMYSSGYEGSEFRIQWHRFEPDCELPPLVQTVPHVAFKVDDLDKAIEGKKLIMEPYYPLEGFRVAIIEDGGAPIEFIQTDLSEDEIIARAHEHSC
jgi:hypothetical protein